MAENEIKLTKYLDTALSTAAEKSTDHLITNLLGIGAQIYTQNAKAVKVKTYEAFRRYLELAYNRLNKMKTLATGLDTVSIIGENSIYVNGCVRYSNLREKKSKDIEVFSVKDLEQLGNQILIMGTGGAGKTMLMKYLFLNTKNRGSHVPVFLELRKASSLAAGEISIPKLIYTCMKDFDVDLSEEMLEYSLQYGGYLFLFDGYDEVKEAVADESAHAVQAFAAKYPNNVYIVTSREQTNLPALFPTFEIVKTLPLDAKKAVELASRLGGGSQRNQRFCEELQEHLYEKYMDFAGNPLLLTMMYLVHMRNGSVPDYLADFYGKCFEALYGMHDSFHKENYVRPLKCALNEWEFRKVFASFCFATYFRETYEFDKSELLGFLEKSIAKVAKKDSLEEDYLYDLTEAVCLLVKDGQVYKFAHRNFQMYFAAVYVTEHLNDEEQRKIAKLTLDGNLQNDPKEFHRLWYQLNEEQFKRNLLEPELRALMQKVDQSDEPDLTLLKLVYTKLFFVEKPAKPKEGLRTEYKVYLLSEGAAYTKVFAYLFEWVIKEKTYLWGKTNTHERLEECLSYYVNHMAKQSIVASTGAKFIPDLRFRELDALSSKEEIAFRDALYKEVIEFFAFSEARNRMTLWLKEQEDKRKKALEAKMLESFLDALL